MKNKDNGREMNLNLFAMKNKDNGREMNLNLNVAR
jgi:hypothetical protein